MTKSFSRTDRIEAELRRALGALVRDAVAEHGLPSVSVSDVEVTRDMAHAKVFVTALQPERSKEALDGLKAAAGEIRFRLARAEVLPKNCISQHLKQFTEHGQPAPRQWL